MEVWLRSLKTNSPQEGFELARMGVKYTQSNMEVLKEGRKDYASDASFLIQASKVISIHFQTVAKANKYWNQ